MSDLSNFYMIAKLSVRTWQAAKTDKEISQEVNTSKSAQQGASRVVKNLLAGCDDKLKATQSAYNSIRLWFYANTAPWGLSEGRSGTRLIATELTLEFIKEFGQRKAAAESALAEFLNDYDSAVLRAKGTLGHMYKPEEYPTRDALAHEFGAAMTLEPVPATVDYARLQSLPGPVVIRLQEMYERRMTEQQQQVVEDLQDRILAEVNRMAVQLGKVAAGEKTRLFDSMTENLAQLVKLSRGFGKLSPQLMAIADRVEQDLLQNKVSEFKGNAALSRVVAGKAESVALAITSPAPVAEEPSTVEFNEDDYVFTTE